MGTRSLANELDDIARKELADLAPEDRLHLVLKATAANDEDAIDRLVSTLPTYSYKARDLDYRRLVTNSMLVSLQAERDLIRGWLEYQWIDTALTNQILTDMLDRTFVDGELAIDDPSDLHEQETPEDVSEDLGVLEERLVDIAMDLYIDYHTYQAFAHEQLGVSLETLLSHASQRRHIIEFVEETLDNCEEEGLLARANEWIAEVISDVEAEAKANPELGIEDHDIAIDITLDDLAESQYNGLIDEWQGAI